ncbi:putative serine/threonine-protein kinase [Sesbania bispinosa]|nr:putative serine/threonine-protein kinase [Sesbania bispinosa]
MKDAASKQGSSSPDIIRACFAAVGEIEHKGDAEEESRHKETGVGADYGGQSQKQTRVAALACRRRRHRGCALKPAMILALHRFRNGSCGGARDG